MRVTPRTVLLRLALDGASFPFLAGQAVVAGVPGRPARKPYAIACAPALAARLGILELLVQVDPLSPEPHLEEIAAGSWLEIDGPFGESTLAPGVTALLLVAGGTGIAPLRAILWEALMRPAPPAITVVYSARTAEDLAFVEELAALAGAGRIALHLTTTRESGPAGHHGRIDAAWLAGVLPSPDVHVHVCGPDGFVRDVTAMLEALGVPPARVAQG